VSGDLACKHVNGACFLVEDLAAEQLRSAAFEISASGPMFGSKMKQPEGEARQLEDEIIRQAGIECADFDLPGGLRMEGERRPLRVPVGELSWELSEDRLTLGFSLPKGSYATSFVREITKTF
jgi:tRNA pseudouridine13 synthase